MSGMKQAKASPEDIQSLIDFFNELEEMVEDNDASNKDLGVFIKKQWREVGCNWRRVVFGCEMLIQNCCDPEADTLEWRKDVAEFLKSKATQ